MGGIVCSEIGGIVCSGISGIVCSGIEGIVCSGTSEIGGIVCSGIGEILKPDSGKLRDWWCFKPRSWGQVQVRVFFLGPFYPGKQVDVCKLAGQLHEALEDTHKARCFQTFTF